MKPRYWVFLGLLLWLASALLGDLAGGMKETRGVLDIAGGLCVLIAFLSA